MCINRVPCLASVLSSFSSLTEVTFLMLQPKTTFKFPIGEVSLEEREDEEVKKTLSISGIAKGQVLDGICTAHYRDEELKLRYAYKVIFLDVLSLPTVNVFK